MNIVVIGAGAIGSFYGAKLSKLNDVTLAARKKHADKINKDGLKVTGMENKTYRLRAVEKIKSIGDKSLILLTTKVYGSKDAISGIKGLIKKDTVVLCLQNGLYSENIVKSIIGKKCRILRAITNFGASFLKPGIVKYNNYSYTAIEKSPISEELAGNFSKCGLNAHASQDIKKDMWKKLVFNCVLNPVTSILGIENRGISDEKLNPLKKLIVGECLKVAEKDGVRFDIDFMKILNTEFRLSRNISSMQQDLLKGKCTEIDYLNGAVAELGKKYGISCPVNEALVAIIKYMEKEKTIQIFK